MEFVQHLPNPAEACCCAGSPELVCSTTAFVHSSNIAAAHTCSACEFSEACGADHVYVIAVQWYVY